MSVDLEKHQDILDELGEHAGEILRASWGEAARVFSSRGIEKVYLEGATGLLSLGRGTDLVVSFLQSATAVARELGEDSVSDMLAATIKMYSKTSASVIAAIFSSSPVAAARLGDPELFRAYLHLLDTLLAQAPRGLRCARSGDKFDFSRPPRRCTDCNSACTARDCRNFDWVARILQRPLASWRAPPK